MILKFKTTQLEGEGEGNFNEYTYFVEINDHHYPLGYTLESGKFNSYSNNDNYFFYSKRGANDRIAKYELFCYLLQSNLYFAEKKFLTFNTIYYK